jgi:hypothetical protein
MAIETPGPYHSMARSSTRILVSCFSTTGVQLRQLPRPTATRIGGTTGTMVQDQQQRWYTLLESHMAGSKPHELYRWMKMGELQCYKYASWFHELFTSNHHGKSPGQIALKGVRQLPGFNRAMAFLTWQSSNARKNWRQPTPSNCWIYGVMWTNVVKTIINHPQCHHKWIV